MPLNVASYVSRSLDSAILPAFIPATAAAAYARSYQVVVTPVTQLQLSLGPAILERLARARDGSNEDALLSRTWRLLMVATGSASVVIGALSMVIADVLFGPGWPQASVFVAGMVCGLPALTVVVFCSWRLQLRGELQRSVRHLLVMLLPPVLVIAVATQFGPQGAVATLAALGAFTPAIVLSANIGAYRAGPRPIVMFLQCIGWWSVTALIFAAISLSAGFWHFQNW